MSRLVEGIKELLHGKDDDEPEYRYRTGYDQRQPIESTRYYGYPANATSEVRSGFQRPYGEDYRRGSYEDSSYSSRRRYGSGRRGESDSDEDVIELMVPMCCDKCKEKVEEELGEVEGVESIHCDQDRDRVVVRGSNIDTDRCLVKAERAVKKKCELISHDSDDEVNRRRDGYGSYKDSGYESRRLYRGNSGGRSGRPSLGRLPSFASGKVMVYDGVGALGQDYEEKDYNGFRRMPSMGRHRHHDAEFITSFNQRPEPRDARRDYYGVGRRMPSFNRHRFHDAEYINTDYSQPPRTFYEQNASARGSTYTAAYNDRPSYQSQVSFSRLNPSYANQYIQY